jgi:phosphatidylinositol-3,4,5-trisphosphate 3-phosphatase/dual-specificity protein phosphatase PTEN
MGFPSEGKEGIYRNHMKDVKKYFDGFHKDHYKVYNL